LLHLPAFPKFSCCDIGILPKAGEFDDFNACCSGKEATVKRIAAYVLLGLAVAQLAARSWRHRDGIPLWDFADVYSCARAWVTGAHPYDTNAARKVWIDGTGRAPRDLQHWTAVYPPPSLFMLAPFAVLAPMGAIAAWAVLLVTLLALQLSALMDLAGLSWRDPWGLLLIAGSIASAPLQFGLLCGQPSMVAVSLTVLAIWCAARRRDRAAGVLLGIACAFKPHVSIAFLLYYLCTRRWRVAETAGAVIAAVFAVSLIAMQVTRPDWATRYVQSVASTTETGGVNDRLPTGPFRDQIIDVQMALLAVITHPIALQVAAACLTAGLLAWYVRAFPRDVARQHELMPLAVLAAISLLPLYHRVYDAALLTLALAWALAVLKQRAADGGDPWPARIVILVLCVFLIPFDVLHSLRIRFGFVEALASTRLWHALIVPHYAWATLIATLVLLYAMQRQSLGRQRV
jgi:hypothetical protein